MLNTILLALTLLIGVAMDNKTYDKLESTISSLTKEFDEIPAERKKDLQELAGYLKEKVSKNEEIKLTFICTHNSRRSHMSQIWAQTAANYYGIKNVK